MLRLLGHLTKQKRQKRKDVRATRAVKSNVSDATGAMDSSEQIILSSVEGIVFIMSRCLDMCPVPTSVFLSLRINTERISVKFLGR